MHTPSLTMCSERQKGCQPKQPIFIVEVVEVVEVGKLALVVLLLLLLIFFQQENVIWQVGDRRSPSPFPLGTNPLSPVRPSTRERLALPSNSLEVLFTKAHVCFCIRQTRQLFPFVIGGENHPSLLSEEVARPDNTWKYGLNKGGCRLLGVVCLMSATQDLAFSEILGYASGRRNQRPADIFCFPSFCSRQGIILAEIRVFDEKTVRWLVVWQRKRIKAVRLHIVGVLSTRGT